MKIYLLLLLFIFVAQNVISQEQNQVELKGLGFLQWKSNKKIVENLLKQKEIEIENTYSEAAYNKITRFWLNEMYTWLYFDSHNKLNKIEQYKQFSVIQNKEADEFFEKVKKSLLQDYGKPDSEKNDTTQKLITINWKLEFSNAVLTYDYKYKIIDELGCCSYKIDLLLTPLK